MLKERRIQQAWIEQVLQKPDWRARDNSDPTLMRAFGVVRDAGGKTLRVVYKDVGSDRVVVTVFFDRDAVNPSRRRP